MSWRSISSFILFFFTCFLCYSQNKVFGTIKDKEAKPLSFALVRVDQNPQQYSVADKNGYFELMHSKMDSLSLSISSLGFITKKIQIPINKDAIELHLVLEVDVYELDAVFIQSELAVQEKNDTIRIKTKYFADGLESNVADLLNKIPGVTVDSEGTIKVNGSEIDKLLIDGDDLFDRGYGILSQNMPAYPIEEIEILNKYSSNPLLKNIESSDRTAINLKLDDSFKRVWFGNIATSVGNDSYREIKANLMNFGKKNKYYFLGETNNIGNNSTGDIQHLIRPSSSSQVGEIGYGKGLGKFINLNPSLRIFKENRINFNDSKLISLNAIFNPNSKLQVKPIFFYNANKENFFREGITEVNTHNTSFINTENYKLNNRKNTAFGKLDLKYDLSDTKLIETSTSYNNGQFKDASDLIFNEEITNESLKHQNRRFNQIIKFTNKIDDQKVLLLTARYINEKQPQNYRIHSPTYSDLFPEQPKLDNVMQEIQNSMQYVGLNAHFLNRKINSDLLEIQIGNEYSKENLLSVFSLLEDDKLLDKPVGFQNNVNNIVNDAFIKGSYKLAIRDVSLTSTLEAHHLSYKFESTSTTNTPSFSYLQPSLRMQWKINNKNTLISYYSYTTKNNGMLSLYPEYILTSYRSFRKGSEESFTPLKASNAFIHYKFGNWSDRFFTNLILNYSKDHDFLSTNTIVSQNYTQSEIFKINNRETLFVKISSDYFLKKLQNNLKVDLGWNSSEYKNITNGFLQEVTSQNFSYGMELRSAFVGGFNYHLGFTGYTNTIKSVNKLTSNKHNAFVDLLFHFNDRMNLQLQSEYYYFGNLDKNKEYYFLDFNLNYTLVDGKLFAKLTGKNLFNTERFKDYSITDISTSITEYRILPRMLLLKLEYRF